MRKRKLKISLHRISETKKLRMVLHIRVYRKEETSLWYTFFMVRNLSDFNFCCSLSVAYLYAKSGWNGSAFGRGFRLGLLLY